MAAQKVCQCQALIELIAQTAKGSMRVCQWRTQVTPDLILWQQEQDLSGLGEDTSGFTGVQAPENLRNHWIVIIDAGPAYW